MMTTDGARCSCVDDSIAQPFGFRHLRLVSIHTFRTLKKAEREDIRR